MHKFAIISFFILWSNHAFSSKVIDSLIQSLSEITSEKAKIKTYNNLAEQLIRKDNIKALEYAELAIKLAQSTNDYLQFGNALALKTEAQNQLGQYQEAEINAYELIEIAELHKFKHLESEAYHLLGVSQFYQGANDKALASYHKALGINEQIDRKDLQLKQLNNIALIHREEGQFERAIEYLNQCATISKSINNLKYNSICVGNIGYIYLKQEKYDDALPIIHQITNLNKDLGDITIICTGYYLLADTYYHLGKLEQGLEAAKTAEQISIQIEYTTGQIYAYRVMGDIYKELNDASNARKFAYAAKKISEEKSTYIYYIEILKSIFKIEKKFGNHTLALQIHETLFTYTDSLSQADVKQKIEDSEFKYEAIKKEKENQILLIQKDQSQRLLYISLFIISLLGIVAYLWYQALQRKKKYSLTLENAISQRTKDLENSTKELERFTYIASHDLKEPLRNIISFSTLLESNIEKNKLDKTKEYAFFVSKNAKQLYALVEDILAFSTLRDIKEIDTVDVNLDQLMNKITALLETNIIAKNASITWHNLPDIKGDESLLLLLFKNLIENGIKYNRNPTPSIHIYSSNTDSAIEINVKDNGIGFDTEYKDQLFQMFKRLHSRGEFSGSGMGLAISKKIADFHGFDIKVSSELDLGSIFTVSIQK